MITQYNDILFRFQTQAKCICSQVLGYVPINARRCYQIIKNVTCIAKNIYWICWNIVISINNRSTFKNNCFDTVGDI